MLKPLGRSAARYYGETNKVINVPSSELQRLVGHCIEIRTQMVVIRGPTRYQLDRGGATLDARYTLLERASSTTTLC